MMQGLLEGRKIMVTGGSRGIGRSVVETCINHGAFVGFTHTGRSGKIEDMPDGGCIDYICDTTDLEYSEKTMADFNKRGPKSGIDGLVLNAGIYRRSVFEELEKTDWERTLDVNLTGSYNTIKGALPHMESGSIVMVSSQLAFRGSGHGPDYSASKAGLLGLARSLAIDLAPGIRVNSVAPGFVDTDILAGDSPEKRKSRISKVPLGRIGGPDEIAAPIVFLLSELSSYVTGATLDINGGLFIH